MSSSTFTTDSRSRSSRAQPAITHIRPHSKTRVAYFHNKDVGSFHYGVGTGVYDTKKTGHPMKPHRLTLTNDLVINYGLHELMDVYCPRMATEAELLEFHESDYVNFLKKITPQNRDTEFADVLGNFNFGDDCPVFDGLWDFCRIYTGASLAAAQKLCMKDMEICVNWSGGLHHAKSYEASGFCYVNDIVLAIRQLLKYYARVLYIDIDIHHGDGVQEAFYCTDRVMTVSFHKYEPGFFPGTGDTTEIGSELGKYYSINVPLKNGIDDDSYVNLFKTIMTEVKDRYQPSVVVLQCGADSLGLDRLGAFNLSIKAHGDCVKIIKSWQIPLLVLGGGGYTIHNVARCWAYETSVLLDANLPNEIPRESKYLDFFEPDYKLHPHLVGRVDNQNTKTDLKRLTEVIFEQLRHLDGAPVVQMQELPDGIAEYLQEADEELADTREDQRANKRIKRSKAHDNEFFDGDSDQEQDEEDTMDLD
ncbi:9847_t:CDS:2 [Ambispora leptoticha]|uniref:Histone deacetylase n=1 Tax=Ambispora leptoticha TaxID=144679 RepID=A0A9N9BM81_9GLOM|nr:9847_t:CDS:2 [Ambispora leptoticha]